MNSNDILNAACRAYEARADALGLGAGGVIRRCWIENGDMVVVESLCERFYYKIFGQELVAAAPPVK